MKPDAPTGIVTENDDDQIVIEWDIPEKNGATITEYKISIKDSGNVYKSVDSSYCNGKDSSLLAQT